MQNRAFNGFPCLVMDEQLAIFQNEFQTLAEKITDTIQTDKGFRLVKKEDQEQVTQWGQKIVNYACEFLLEAKSIQEDIIQALGIKDTKESTSPEFIQAITSSFVGNIILEHIMPPLSKSIAQHQESYHAVCSHINSHYPKWIQLCLENHGISVKISNEASIPFAFQWLSEPKKAITVTAVFTGAIMLGYALFKRWNAEDESKVDNQSRLSL